MVLPKSDQSKFVVPPEENQHQFQNARGPNFDSRLPEKRLLFEKSFEKSKILRTFRSKLKTGAESKSIFLEINKSRTLIGQFWKSFAKNMVRQTIT